MTQAKMDGSEDSPSPSGGPQSNLVSSLYKGVGGGPEMFSDLPKAAEQTSPLRTEPSFADSLSQLCSPHRQRQRDRWYHPSMDSDTV